MAEVKQYSLAELLRVMQRLRDPQSGCPWDLKQDFSTIAPSTLEEAYELVAAIEHEDFDHIREELGDVLFQVIFYAQMGSEEGRFDFADIVHTLVEKLVRRHPHVFGGGDIEGQVDGPSSIAGVKESWEAIKQQERNARDQSGVLDDVPLALPALSRAQKVQKRASRVGFDWNSAEEVLEKVDEELAEFRDVVAGEQGQEQREEELGDLLFTCVNLARHSGIDAEAALRRATQKFEQRFSYIENTLTQAGSSLELASLEEMDELWNLAKDSE